jgi:hypothetical protein
MHATFSWETLQTMVVWKKKTGWKVDINMDPHSIILGFLGQNSLMSLCSCCDESSDSIIPRI